MTDYLTRQERFILDWTGPILIGIGAIGLLFTVIFDRIAGRIGTGATFGWVQILGVFVCLSILIFGIYVDKYHGEIKQILDDYVRK